MFVCGCLTDKPGFVGKRVLHHGDKSQPERDNVLNQFRSGRTPVLVATDVAARGLDVKDIRYLYNPNPPSPVKQMIKLCDLMIILANTI